MAFILSRPQCVNGVSERGPGAYSRMKCFTIMKPDVCNGIQVQQELVDMTRWQEATATTFQDDVRKYASPYVREAEYVTNAYFRATVISIIILFILSAVTSIQWYS